MINMSEVEKQFSGIRNSHYARFVAYGVVVNGSRTTHINRVGAGGSTTRRTIYVIADNIG